MAGRAMVAAALAVAKAAGPMLATPAPPLPGTWVALADMSVALVPMADKLAAAALVEDTLAVAPAAALDMLAVLLAMPAAVAAAADTLVAADTQAVAVVATLEEAMGAATGASFNAPASDPDLTSAMAPDPLRKIA